MEPDPVATAEACSLDAFPALLGWTVLPLALGARLLEPTGTHAPAEVLRRHGAADDSLQAACWQAWTRVWTGIGATTIAGSAAAATGWTAMLLPARNDLRELVRRVVLAPPPSLSALARALDEAAGSDPSVDQRAAAEADLAVAAWMREAITDDQALGVLASGRLRAMFECAWRLEIATRPALLAPLLLAERLTLLERHELLTAAGVDEAAIEVVDEHAAATSRRIADRVQARRDLESLVKPKRTIRWGEDPAYEQAGALSTAAAAAIAAGGFEEAAGLLERALELDDRRPTDWLALARVRFERGLWAEGMSAYRSAIDLDGGLRLTPHGIELLRVLDRGTFGNVRFVARSGDGDFEVEPLPPRLLDPARMVALETRCLRLSAADHPDIVRSQVLRHGPHVMLVTPRIRGKTFATAWLEDDYDAERLFHLVDCVCEQVGVLHAAGIHHGALTPEAITVDWPRVRVGWTAVAPLAAADPRVLPDSAEDVHAIGQLLANSLERGSRRMTTVGLLYRPLVELLAMTLGPPATRATLGRFRAALAVIRYDPGALHMLSPG